MVIAGTNSRSPAENRDLAPSVATWLALEHRHTGSHAASATINLRFMAANPNLALTAGRLPAVSFEVD